MSYAFNLSRRTARPRGWSHRLLALSLLTLLGFGAGCQEGTIADANDGTAAQLDSDPGQGVPAEPADALNSATAVGGVSLPAPLPPSTGAAFYVSPSGSDANAGTLAAPWKTLQKAMNTLTAGQTAYVRAGTYRTGGAFGTKADTYNWTKVCAASAPCSIVAYQKERPVIHGQLRISGAYLRLSGFIIEGPLSANVASCSGRRANQVDLSDSHDLELSNNEIRKNDYHAGVTAYRVHHVRILNNWIHDNGRFTLAQDPCTGSPTNYVDHGVYWGSTVGGGNLMANNLIEHNRAKGLLLYPNASDVIVTQNTIVANGDYGIKIAGSTSNRNTIVNNIVAYSPKPQIRIEVGNGNAVMRNLTWSPNAKSAGISNSTGSMVRDNQVGNPLFVAPSSGGNWRVQAGSPAIDRALAEWAAGTALDGVTRPKGGGSDLGAYER
jgi:parallel beta helix pectate lyase-like protein